MVTHIADDAATDLEAFFDDDTTAFHNGSSGFGSVRPIIWQM